MTRDTDLEKAYRQLQAYKRCPPGTSPLMDALAAAWNQGIDSHLYFQTLG